MFSGVYSWPASQWVFWAFTAVGDTPRDQLVAIGTSTGGPVALQRVLTQLPGNFPAPIVLVQHMPAAFTKAFAERLDKLCRISVKEASDGERILPGHAYIAPGDMHLSLGRSGANYVTELDQGPPVNRHRPAVEAKAPRIMRTTCAMVLSTSTGPRRTGLNWNV